jgi:hypothetical protein
MSARKKQELAVRASRLMSRAKREQDMAQALKDIARAAACWRLARS